MSAADSTYNGWANYETWAVGMFLDGNYTGEGTYRYVLESVEQIVRDNDGTAENMLPDVAGFLKDYVEESMPDLGASLAADLLGAAVSSVDWHALASSKLSEIGDES